MFSGWGSVSSAAFPTNLPRGTSPTGGLGPPTSRPPAGTWESTSCARGWRALELGSTDIQPGPLAKEGTGKRSFIVDAVSMISRGQTHCPTYRFHHHQTHNMLFRYRIDAGFRAFCRRTRKGNALYYRPCGSRIGVIPYPDSLTSGVRLGRSLRRSMAI